MRCHDENEFQCKTSKRCIPRNWVRDGSVDCSLNDVSLLNVAYSTEMSQTNVTQGFGTVNKSITTVVFYAN